MDDRLHDPNKKAEEVGVRRTRTKSRSQGTIAKMSKFVNKAAAERKINKKKGKELLKRDDDADGSWGQFSGLDQSHASENS